MTTRYLDDADIVRIRAELGDNVVAALANPYIGVRAVYDVIQSYVQTDVEATSSATSVTAAGPVSPDPRVGDGSRRGLAHRGGRGRPARGLHRALRERSHSVDQRP